MALSAVVQITFAGNNVPTVRQTPSVERASNAVITNALVDGLLAPVRTTPNVRMASNAVTANASLVGITSLTPLATKKT